MPLMSTELSTSTASSMHCCRDGADELELGADDPLDDSVFESVPQAAPNNEAHMTHTAAAAKRRRISVLPMGSARPYVAVMAPNGSSAGQARSRLWSTRGARARSSPGDRAQQGRRSSAGRPRAT